MRDAPSSTSRVLKESRYSRELPGGDGFAYDCAHHHPVLANRVFPAQRQIGRFCGDFRPLISRIFVSVSAHPFWRRYLGACLRIQKFRSRRPGSGTKSGRTCSTTSIVIAGPDQGPDGMGQTLDIGGGSIVLRVQRVDLLVEPMLGRDPRIDRAADWSDGWSLHGRASNRRSIFPVPEAEEARTVPLGACDGEGNFGEAVISLAIPGKAVGHHHHPLRLSIPLPHQHCTGREFSSLAVKAGETGGRYRPSFFRNRSVQHLLRLVIEIAKAISLDSIGDDRKRQTPRQMSGRRPLKYGLPA